MVLLGSAVVATGLEVGLGVDAVLGAFFVHGEDACLPFGIGAQDGEANVGDGAGVVAGNSFSYRFYQYRTITLVVESVGELGLMLHPSEEEVGRPRHAELAHLLFMYQFDGRIAELFVD